MLPAPRQKLPEISPILKADTVRLHVSREKDKEIALIDAGWDDTKVVQPDGCGQARGGCERGILPPGRGSDDPPLKTRPPSGPLIFSSYGCRSRWITAQLLTWTAGGWTTSDTVRIES